MSDNEIEGALYLRLVETLVKLGLCPLDFCPFSNMPTLTIGEALGMPRCTLNVWVDR